MRPMFMRLMPGLMLLLAQTLVPSPAFAHGGGLDRHGCHNNRKTGGYHCHGGAAPARSNVIAPRRGFAPSGRRQRSGAFANCTEARAAGAAPVHRGDPGYGRHLDRDNDGVGCEPYRGR